MLMVIMLAAFFICLNSSFAFQYEDYFWGRSLKETKEAVKKKHKEIVSSEIEKTVSYTQTLFDSPCEVTLYFTKPNEFLFMVKFVWKTPLVGEKVLDHLVKSHGEPLQPDENMNRFAWTADNGESIALDVNSEVTELYYAAGEDSKTPNSDDKEKPDTF
jgi:hypothetical protein